MFRNTDNFEYLCNQVNNISPIATRTSEKMMIDSIKSNGNVNINELSNKQVIALVSLWGTDFAKKENVSFSEMLKRCYKSTPWHENARMFYIHADEITATTIHHAFYDMNEGEEEMVMKALNN